MDTGNEVYNKIEIKLQSARGKVINSNSSRHFGDPCALSYYYTE